MIRATWDEGWVGKHVNAAAFDASSKQSVPDVKDSEDRVLLYVLMNGERFIVTQKGKVGF